MWVKLCANTNLHDAQLAAELGADAVGFVFAPSKRIVTPAQVAEITRHLPGSVEKVGVFPVASAQEIIDGVRIAGLTGAQLHGAPNPALIAELSAAFEGRVKLLQVVGYEASPADPVAAEAKFQASLRTALAQPGLDGILLDAAKSGVSGGLGVAFDWIAAAKIVREVFDEARAANAAVPRLIIAGGLRAENVAEAIRLFQPDGVDVASGVEAEPGRKGPAKMRAFLDAARGAF